MIDMAALIVSKMWFEVEPEPEVAEAGAVESLLVIALLIALIAAIFLIARKWWRDWSKNQDLANWKDKQDE